MNTSNYSIHSDLLQTEAEDFGLDVMKCSEDGILEKDDGNDSDDEGKFQYKVIVLGGRLIEAGFPDIS